MQSVTAKLLTLGVLMVAGGCTGFAIATRQNLDALEQQIINDRRKLYEEERKWLAEYEEQVKELGRQTLHLKQRMDALEKK